MLETLKHCIFQVSVYTSYYIDKALADGRNIGLPLTLEHFSDATMETAHKRPKEGNILFSGGRDGPAHASLLRFTRMRFITSGIKATK